MTSTDEPPAEVAADRDLLRGLIVPDGAVTDVARAVATRFDLGQVRDVVALPGAGRRNAALVTDAGSWVLRVGSDLEVLRKERYFAGLIHNTTNLAAAWPYDIDASGDLLSHPYAVMPRLPGETVWWSQDLDWLAVGEALADATLELHRTVWPAAGEWDPVIDDIAPDARPAALRCHARADDLQRRLTASGHQLDDESRRWVQQQLPPLDQPDDAEAIRLIHGDLVIGNVGLTRTDGRWRVTGVFDLEAARVGEPEDDVIVHLWWACFGGRPEAAVSFLRRYRPDGAFSPRLHAYLVLSLLANWEFGQRNHEPWYGDARTFTEWARPLTAAVDRVLAEAYGSTRGGA